MIFLYSKRVNLSFKYISMAKKNLFTPWETDVVLFDENLVRREWHNDEWYFSVIDVVNILSESKSKDKWAYWRKLKERLNAEWSQIVTNCHELKMKANDGKKYPTDTANTETLLRIIQSIPSPNAEPLKQWLASLGNERIEEANDPELGIIRARERAILAYKRKGMSGDEAKRRMSMIESRVDLTDEYKARGIVGIEYSILTNKAYSIFGDGMTAQKIKDFKGLWKNDNPRDHMNKTEMLLTELTEETSKNIIQSKNAKWFQEIEPCVEESVKIVSTTKDQIEQATQQSVLSDQNRLTERQKVLREKEKQAQKKLGNKK